MKSIEYLITWWFHSLWISFPLFSTPGNVWRALFEPDATGKPGHTIRLIVSPPAGTGWHRETVQSSWQLCAEVEAIFHSLILTSYIKLQMHIHIESYRYHIYILINIYLYRYFGLMATFRSFSGLGLSLLRWEGAQPESGLANTRRTAPLGSGAWESHLRWCQDHSWEGGCHDHDL